KGLDALENSDLETANYYYWRAAELGHTPSEINYGISLLKGWGVPQDLVRAWQWLAMAGSAPMAGYYRGLMLHAGLGRDRDDAAARSQYETAAIMPTAQGILAVMYDLGLGGERDIDRAKALMASFEAIDSPSKLNEIAWSLAVHSDVAIRTHPLVLALAERTVAQALAQGVAEVELSMYLDTLAAAQACLGHYAKAVSTQERAIEIAGDELEEGMSERLVRYGRGELWREIQQEDAVLPSDMMEDSIVAVFTGTFIATQPGNRVQLNRGGDNHFALTVLVENVESGSLPSVMDETFTYNLHSPTQFFSGLSQMPGPLRAPAEPHRFTLKEVRQGPYWRYDLAIEELIPSVSAIDDR
ncbi:MAG: tetratricopeptide repeat protein, partial [Pseudomonadota bacterium]